MDVTFHFCLSKDYRAVLCTLQCQARDSVVSVHRRGALVIGHTLPACTRVCHRYNRKPQGLGLPTDRRPQNVWLVAKFSAIRIKYTVNDCVIRCHLLQESCTNTNHHVASNTENDASWAGNAHVYCVPLFIPIRGKAFTEIETSVYRLATLSYSWTHQIIFGHTNTSPIFLGVKSKTGGCIE